MGKKILSVVTRITEFLDPMKIRVHSAYTSFFLVLSVFPLLVLLFGLLGYTSLGLEEVMELISAFVPEAFLPMVGRIISGAYENTSAMVLSISVVTALWSASRSVLGVMEGLNAVYDVKEDRHYLVTRTISVVYTFLFLLVILMTLVLHVFGHAIMDFLRMTTDPILLFLMELIDLRYVFLLVLQSVVFTLMYAFLPNRHNRQVASIPGAVVATLGWTVFSDLFSLYVEFYPNYANIFGSVYAAALAMLWLYICVKIMFYGAALNRWLMERKEKQ